jgi:hypothetical protein
VKFLSFWVLGLPDAHYSQAFYFFTRLGPFKIEEMSEDPFILMFHDIIYDHEADSLKEAAADNLKISDIGLEKTADTSQRTSKQAWIQDRVFIPYNETLDSRAGRHKFHISVEDKVECAFLFFTCGSQRS